MKGSYAIHPTCQMDAIAVNNIYQDAFGFKTDGRFVEVGAYDGRTFSFTWGLSMMGWRGLYAEPVEDFALACGRNHAGRDVHVEHVAVGRECGEAWLYLGGEVSSTKMDRVARNWGLVPEKRVQVKMETLDALLRRVGWREGFDLLVIDVEGAEEDVLRGFSKQVWRPKVVIVELHEKSTERCYLEPNGRNRAVDFANGYFRGDYAKVRADTINTVFVRVGGDTKTRMSL